MEEKVSKEEYNKLKEEFQRLLSAFVNWCGVSSDYIAETYGEEGLRNYYLYIAERVARPILEQGRTNTLGILKGFMDMLGSNCIFEEDENQAMLKMIRCNTGGRMEREGMSKHNKDGVTYYCYHCLM